MYRNLVMLYLCTKGSYKSASRSSLDMKRHTQYKLETWAYTAKTSEYYYKTS